MTRSLYDFGRAHFPSLTANKSWKLPNRIDECISGLGIYHLIECQRVDSPLMWSIVSAARDESKGVDAVLVVQYSSVAEALAREFPRLNVVIAGEIKGAPVITDRVYLDNIPDPAINYFDILHYNKILQFQCTA